MQVSESIKEKNDISMDTKNASVEKKRIISNLSLSLNPSWTKNYNMKQFFLVSHGVEQRKKQWLDFLACTILCK